MEILKTVLFLITVHGIIVLGSCNPEPNRQPDLIIDPLADSLVQNAIETTLPLSINPSDQNKAVSILKNIISKKEFPLANDSLKSLAYHLLGRSYIELSELDSALLFVDIAINMRKIGSYSASELGLAKSYFNRSIVNHKRYKHKQAIVDILLAIKLIEKFPKEIELKGQYFRYTGIYYANLNEPAKAKAYFEQAKNLIKPNTEEEAEYYDLYGKFLEKESLLEEALINYDKSLEIYKNLPNTEFRSAPVKFNRFDLLMDLEPYEEAYPLYANFLSTFQDSTNKLKLLKRAGHHNLAWKNYLNDDLEAAENNYQKELILANELTQGSHSVMLAETYEGLGDVATKKNEFSKGLDYYHRAIQYLSIGFETTDVLALPNLEKHLIINDFLLERIMGLKADALYAKYQFTQKTEDLESTHATYKRLDQLLVQIRQGYKAAPSRYELVEKTLPEYEKATRVSLQLYEKKQEKKYLESAYSFATKNKAIVMLDGLQDEQAQFEGIPSDLLKKENQLKKEVYDLDIKIYELKGLKKEGDTEIKNLTKERFQKTRAYEDLIKSYEEDYPKYFQLKYANNSSIDLKDIRKRLPPSAGVLEYFVGEENIYIFSFSAKTGLQYQEVKKPENFVEDCINYRASIEKDSITSIPEFSEKSFALYDLLVKEPLAQLQESAEINRLIVVPDDILLQVSFETFFTSILPADKGPQWTDKLPFLLRDYAISYAYSNKLIFEPSVNTRLEKAKYEYVGFGLEYDDYTLEALKEIQPAQELPQLFRGMGKLAYSDDEVLESAEVMGGKTYINEKATKPNFLKEVKNGNILHLVTHGYMSKEAPLTSGLVFTKKNQKDDFILRTADLYSMSLPAEMAVLSACHTGAGKVQKGEGIRSLARAFNYAGCPNVTASLWAAPDLSTKKIIVPFYKSIKSGLPKDVCLQKAKLDYLDNCRFNIEALPCNWAHLITIGNVDPITND